MADPENDPPEVVELSSTQQLDSTAHSDELEALFFGLVFVDSVWMSERVAYAQMFADIRAYEPVAGFLPGFKDEDVSMWATAHQIEVASIPAIEFLRFFQGMGARFKRETQNLDEAGRFNRSYLDKKWEDRYDMPTRQEPMPIWTLQGDYSCKVRSASTLSLYRFLNLTHIGHRSSITGLFWEEVWVSPCCGGRKNQQR